MITFTKDISTTKLNLAYTNNIVEFSSDYTSDILKVEVYIGAVVKTLYPSPSGIVFYNIKEWIQSLINVDNFTDDLNTNVLVSGYLYDWTNKVFLNTEVSFKIIYTDSSFEIVNKNYNWLSGYVQIDEWKNKYPLNFDISKPFVLSNFESGTNNKSYVKYWEGYPFDITIYSGVTTPFDITIYSGVTTPFQITNTSNLLNTSFSVQYKVNRLVFSDGSIDTSITDLLTLDNGFNELRITSNSFNTYLTLEKIESSCDGVYVKWVNRFGGWSYWLFNYSRRNRSTNNLGSINNDFNNFEDTISPDIQLGKRSNDTINVDSDSINSEELLLIEDLIDSPKIYIFTGTPFASNNFNDWLEINLKTSDFKTKDYKNKLINLSFQFELPQRNNRTI
jgi:hypothetical protein